MIPFFSCQAPRNLGTAFNALAQRKGSAFQALAQSLSFQQFGYKIRRSLILAQLVDSQNIGMVERRRCAGLLLEAKQTILIVGREVVENLDGNFSIEA